MAYYRNLLDGSVSQLEKENRKIAYQAALEGIVLLQNDGALPLSPGNVALFGAGASRTIKGGTGSGEVNERYSVSILEGLESRGFTVKNKRWIQDYENYYMQSYNAWKTDMKEQLSFFKMISGNFTGVQTTFIYSFGRAVEEADFVGADTDTAIYVVSRQSGEGADRKLDKGENDLQPQELESLRLLRKSFAKVILVINAGCSLNLDTVDEIGVNAVVFYGQQGEEGGNALADILCGKVSPSGKLTTTWAASYNDIPFAQEYSYLKGDVTNEYYKEGIYVDYRYFDTYGVKPRYPFGFGLSYTSFELKPLETTVCGSQVKSVVQVKNTGKACGKEVVQLYVSVPALTEHKEYQRLVTFEKTPLLAPQESCTLELCFDIRDCASYSEQDAAWYLDAGNYVLRIGNSSRSTETAAAVHLGKKVITSKLTNICPMQKEFEVLTSCRQSEEQLTCKILEMAAEDIPCEVIDYTPPKSKASDKAAKLAASMKVKELTDIAVGSGYTSLPEYYVPGFTGLTTSKYSKRGIPNMTLSDGPAGLRLQTRSALTKGGHMKMFDFQFTFLEFMPGIMKAIAVGNEKTDKLHYQYATAFPVAICLAQTWNKELCYTVGCAVSHEMQKFGVTIWLAPALNIIRNPLCGRNFEYYAADPVLAGQIAAAMVQGVQSIPGKYACIKHFACNNQEDNRDHNSSNLNERTLREIYLKGFEIAVKQGKTKTIMSSYNMVNGVYTSASRDLCTKVLRNEWGYDGIVMSDWYSTAATKADTADSIQAGNDLIMPGGGAYCKQVNEAVSSGRLKEEDLRLSAERIIRLAVNSGIKEESGWYEGKKLFKGDI